MIKTCLAIFLFIGLLTFAFGQNSNAYGGAYGYNGGQGSNYGVAGGNYNQYAQNTQAYSNQINAINYQPYSSYGTQYVGPYSYGNNYGSAYSMPYYGLPYYGGFYPYRYWEQIDEIPEDIFYQVEDEDLLIRKNIEKEAERIANHKIKLMMKTLEEMQVDSINKYYREKPILEEERRRAELEEQEQLFYKQERERLLKQQQDEEKKRIEEIRTKKEKDFMDYKYYVDNINSQIEGLVSNITENPTAPSLIDLYDKRNDHPFTAQILHQFEIEGIIENPTLKQEQDDENLINSRFAEQKRREAILNQIDEPSQKNGKKEINLDPLKQSL